MHTPPSGYRSTGPELSDGMKQVFHGQNRRPPIKPSLSALHQYFLIVLTEINLNLLVWYLNYKQECMEVKRGAHRADCQGNFTADLVGN